MKHAGWLALAICLLVPASAEARKECRPSEGELETPSASDDASEESSSAVHWARGNDSSWVHSGGESSWHHDSARSWHGDDEPDVAAPAPVNPVAYDANDGNGWVHETDYGWWAAVDADEATDFENDDGRYADAEEDCTVSKDRNECVVLANQVATYRFRLGLAGERGDERWAENLEFTIARLEARAERYGCPWALEPTLTEEIVATLARVVEAGIVAARVYSMIQRAGLF